MIGYYVHHSDPGHLHRARVVAEALGEPVTGFSSLGAPADWPGPWIQLDRDDLDDDLDGVVDPALAPPGVARASHTAHDRLHRAPLGDAGLRSRMGEIASWIRHVAPDAFVVDVSVEVATLVRLHGIPVVVVALPGERPDPAHHLGYDVADALVGCWPPEATDMLRGIPPHLRERLHPVGAICRFAVAEARPAHRPDRSVVVVEAGESLIDAASLDVARKEVTGWEWTMLEDSAQLSEDDYFSALQDADVVVTHAGESAVADVAAARRPAVLVPLDKPYREQQVTANALWHGGWPVVPVDAWPMAGWEERLERAAALDGSDWGSWCDGAAPARFADVVRSVALTAHP